MQPQRHRRNQTSGARSGWISRTADLHVGRIILWLLGTVRSRSDRPVKEPKIVGLCVFGAIGDALLASAIIPDIKSAHPNAHVTIVVSGSNAGIVPLLPHCDASLLLPIFDPIRSVALLRQCRFDLLIDANQWLRISAVYCALSGARHTVGFQTPGQCRHYAFDSIVRHSADRHEMENYRALLTSLGVVGASCPRLKLVHRDLPRLSAIQSRRYIVLHPWAGGSGAARKEWPTASWVELGGVLCRRGYELVVTGSPADIEKSEHLAETAGQAGVQMYVMAGTLDLGQTAALLQAAALVVSVNTGIMHMAAALGTPLVALHGPTNPRRWGPLSRDAISVVPDPISKAVPIGYLNLGFEFPKSAPDCMAFVSVENVVAAVDTLIGADDQGDRRVPASPNGTD